MFFQFPRASLGSFLYLWYLQYAFSLFHFHEVVVNYVNPGSGWSRRSLDLEVSISPGRRAEILIAVTAGGYCLTRTCSRGGHTICRGAAKQLTNTTHSLQWSHPHLNSIFASKLHARDPLHWVICIRLIRWHGAHLQAVVTVMEIILPDPEILYLYMYLLCDNKRYWIELNWIELKYYHNLCRRETWGCYLSWCLAMWLHMQVIYIFIITFFPFFPGVSNSI